LTAPLGDVVAAVIAETGREPKWFAKLEGAQLPDRFLGSDPS
jgi:hypothetical protein